MSKTGRAIMTSIGGMGEEVIEFPSSYIQPSKQNKRRIQSGYLDLLYYEYREQAAAHMDNMAYLLLVVAFAVYLSQPYTSAAAIVLAIGGAIILAKNRGTSKEFRKHRHALAAQLLRVGVRIKEPQLAQNMGGNSAWGQLREHSVSDLGIVRPAPIEPFISGSPYTFQYAFDILEDKVYH